MPILVRFQAMEGGIVPIDTEVLCCHEAMDAIRDRFGWTDPNQVIYLPDISKNTLTDLAVYMTWGSLGTSSGVEQNPELLEKWDAHFLSNDKNLDDLIAMHKAAIYIGIPRLEKVAGLAIKAILTGVPVVDVSL